MNFLKKLPIESMVHQNSRLNRLVSIAFVLAVFATLSTTVVENYYLPLGVDGGWYSYPALSLARGSDAREHMDSIGELRNLEGVKVSFRKGDDFARSIRIIPMAWWFMAFGKTIWAAKLFGILELFILMTMMGLLLRQVATERNILLLCWAVYLTDGTAISSGASDLRADIMLTIFTVAVLLFARIEDKKGYRILLFIGGNLCIVFLALTRVSSAIPLLILISYLSTELYISWKNISKFKKIFYLSLIATGIIGFVLRNQLLDLFFASKYSFQNIYGAEKYALKKIMSVEVSQVFKRELHRWMNYFFLSNMGELLALILAFFLFLRRIFSRSNKESSPQTVNILVGCTVATGGLAFISPVPWAASALPAMPLFILLLASELKAISNYRNKNIILYVLVAIVFVSAGLNVAHGGKVSIMSIRDGFSNAAVTEAINHVFKPETKTSIVIGGTELWPYFDLRRNVIIVDARTSRRINELSDIIESVDFIFLNKDYSGYGWEEYFSKRYPNIKLRIIAEVGNPSSGWNFIKIMKPYFLKSPEDSPQERYH